MQVEINGLPVYYEIHGKGRPLVCIHGFSPDHHLMTGCMEPVFDQRDGWQRLYFDLPGMGKTPGPDWITCTDDMLDLVLAFIDQMIPGQPFTVAGESYGGYIAQGIVHHRPEWVDGMLLICPLAEADSAKHNNPPQTVLVQDNEFLATLTDKQREGFQFVAVVQTRPTWERTDREVNVGLEAYDKDFLNTLSAPENYGFTFSVNPLPAPFNKPTLMLLGRQDHMVGYQNTWAILENYPRASLAVLDRAGHNLQIEQPALFNALVHEWLDRVEESLS
ncbi:MAG: alpha/beta hydrolase [Anaerolineae bacterium]|nr:alpha/beta hydrolase [Anaerolineae bacterium]